MEFLPQEDRGTILLSFGEPKIFTYLWGGSGSLAKWGPQKCSNIWVGGRGGGGGGTKNNEIYLFYLTPLVAFSSSSKNS